MTLSAAGLAGRLFLGYFSSNFVRFFFFSFFFKLQSPPSLQSLVASPAASQVNSASWLPFRMDVDVLIKERLFGSFFPFMLFFADLPRSGASSWNLTTRFSFGLSEVSSRKNIWLRFSKLELRLRSLNASCGEKTAG